MKIAVFHNQPSGGARRALVGFCRELSRRHLVDVFRLESADRSLLEDESAHTVTTLEYAPLPSVRGGLWVNDLRRRRDLDRLRHVNWLAARQIDAGAYDVVLVDADRFTYAPYVLESLCTPSAYYCHHGPWRADGVRRAPQGIYGRMRALWHQPFASNLQARLQRDDQRLTRQAHLLLTNSMHTRRRIEQEYGLEALVCPPGVDLPPVANQTRRNLLSVGEIEAHKGHDLVVRAVAQLTVPRPPLHIVGNACNPHEQQRLLKLAKALGVDMSIRVGISEQELGTEYEQAIAFLYGARQEPLGLSPLEAMAHSLPVVAVDEGGVRETVLHGITGLRVPPEPSSFAYAVRGLLANPELRCEMGKHGRMLVESQWAWSIRARTLESALESMVEADLVSA
jgi:glycosyltransferase involved in cell wall biosynthesis